MRTDLRRLEENGREYGVAIANMGTISLLYLEQLAAERR